MDKRIIERRERLDENKPTENTLERSYTKRVQEKRASRIGVGRGFMFAAKWN